ncbi:hypothetical protein MoryE10_26020 [Methylogaea oryzae]|uniref:Uncharacterized protein n=3 Tax=Methylogaea oryzae TaxID=1295382 RepID=A0A8D5AJ33_9GAMM|nr:hypothetical protein MoryE10_26020 [Methylogaea oryzae]
MRLLSAVLVGLAVMLAGCGPIYHTDYQMLPAASAEGRMCGNSCLSSQQSCVQSCRSQSQSCEAMARLESQNDYLSYVNEQQRKGKPVKKSQSDFTHYGNCSDSSCVERCESDYRACHTNCGGRVIPHTYCTAFCD